MKSYILLLICLTTLFFSLSCSKVDPLATEPSTEILATSSFTSEDFFCGNHVVVELVAGKHILGGNVVIGNDEDSLYVIYSAADGWSINEIHVYAGDPYSVPTNQPGTPIPGQFTHVIEFDDPVMNYVVSFSLTDFSSECIGVFAHASITNGSSNETAWSNNVGTNFVEGDASTAWSNGTSFGNLTGTNRWGGYTEYCIQECVDNPVDPEPDCYSEETAWSFGESFEDLTGTSRWGWYSIHDLGESEEYMIYAGQHIECGILSISDDGTDLFVTVQMTNNAYANYWHLFIGDETGLEDLCNNSGAPKIGQFPIHIDQPDSYSFSYSIPLSNIEFTDHVVVAAHFEAMVPCP